MNFKIRDAIKSDMKSVLKLIKELALFEKEPNEVIITEEQLILDGFNNNPKFKCFVAEVKSEIVGMALIYPRYSTWKGPAIHLEDLIVTKKHRGKGIFRGIKKNILATRYHSLIIDRKTLGKDLIVTAETNEKIIMGVMHKKYNIHGVQFHPESIKTPEGINLLKNFLSY